MFGRATIRLGIGPHSSWLCFTEINACMYVCTLNNKTSVRFYVVALQFKRTMENDSDGILRHMSCLKTCLGLGSVSTLLSCVLSWLSLKVSHSFPSKIAPSHGASGTRLLHGSLGSPVATTQTASRSVQLFLRGSRQSIPILYNRPPLFLQNCPFPLGFWTSV